ncbi:beta-ketoacyl-[acyl-carrier-protein] synthase family protein [Dokdonella immobilis]|uniref:3-oxoacyl-[acyl-carrier-protein] synthase-1 n=1 Tax=Dokdonella immobilis TaxID=578942 RepID=A0A1I4ZXP2_9GAMM|nr:beta-ketoacyl-[acyl-carrier-protein] synthase family protein [Dokdonella immobilis]SFN54957.1 3-oxoacyl-[acyl-carrier-protein] synthase-1 [Dokdonella immobilis]
MPEPIRPIAITAYTAVSALGTGLAEHLASLRERRSGLRENDFTDAPLACAIGRVNGLEAQPLPEPYGAYECRNNRLAWAGINADGFLDRAREAIERYGADRVALLVATSTSSIGATEEAYARLDEAEMPADLRRSEVHTPHSLGLFLERVLGTRGPCLTTATACSSSAKIFAKAERLIRLGLVDAAVLAGVDSLCGSVLFGFNSLELVAPQACRPFDARRCGISIGEAAGFALVERDGPARAPRLIGWGESSDAHHMSTPHPEGLGARRALEGALARAGIVAADVDYINLHGTATPKNDEVEGAVVASAFPERVRASSTKGWSGHTLGAAGILEAVITLLAIEHGFVPGTLNCEQPDALAAPRLALDNEKREIRIALSNSFGFGGSNCTLAFARGAEA